MEKDEGVAYCIRYATYQALSLAGSHAENKRNTGSVPALIGEPNETGTDHAILPLLLAPVLKLGITTMKTIRLVLFLLAIAPGILSGVSMAAGPTSELSIHHTAIQKMLVDTLFIDKGRYHLLQQTACQYAYVDSPVVTLTQGRVRIKVRLSGKLAMEVGDQCVGGVGDVVRVAISGRPTFSGEKIVLTDIKVDEVSNDAYRVLLQQFLESAIPRAVAINVREGLQRILADRQSTYEVAVDQLSVTDLTAEDNVLHATLSFSLTAK